MRGKRIARAGLWVFAALLVVVIALAVALSSSSVQSRLAQRVVDELNRSWKGRLAVGNVHVRLDGELLLLDVILRDSTGALVARVDSLAARIVLRALLTDSVHVKWATLGGTEFYGKMDSAGQANVAEVFAPRVRRTSSQSGPDWVVLVDELQIRGRSLSLEYSGRPLLDTDSWSMAGNLSFAQDSLRYSVTLDAAEWLQLDAAGDVAVASAALDARGVAGFILHPQLLQQFSLPARSLATFSGHVDYGAARDSLRAQFDVRSNTMGHVTGSLEMPLAANTRALSWVGTLDSLRPGLLWDDTTATLVSGTVAAQKSPGADWLNGWTIVGDFAPVQYGPARVRGLRINATVLDSVISAQGMLASTSGHARFAGLLSLGDLRGFSGSLTLDADHLLLAELLPDVPDTIAALTGTVRADFHELTTPDARSTVSFVLSDAGTSSLRCDSLRGFVNWAHGGLVLDSVVARIGGARVSGAGMWNADGSLSATADVQLAELSSLYGLPLAGYLPDSLRGSVQAAFELTGTYAEESVRNLRIAGAAAGADIFVGLNGAQRVSVKLIDLQWDSMQVMAAFRAEELIIAGQTLDSVTVVARGTLAELATQIQLWAITDTAEIRADLTLSRPDRGWRIALHRLLGETYGIAWKTEGECNIDIVGTTANVDALMIESDYGKLMASGTVARPGDQDLALELSGIQIADWARLFKVPSPSGLLNARLSLSGPDTNIVGDISATIDSVRYGEQLLADRVTVEAEANSVATSLRAVYTLGGDSIAIARGSLPARLTFSDGVVMNAELPMAGTLKLADRPWMFGYPLLPFGSTIGGRVSGELTVLGSPARPNWLGNLQCRDGSYRDTRYGLDYRAIGADLTLHRDTLFVEHLTLQSSGTLTGSGRILMSFPLPRQLDLDVNLANFEAVDSRNLKARLSGAVSVHGPLDSLHAAGKVRFSEGTYRITQATTKQIEEIDLTAELSRLRGDSTLRQGILVSRFYRPMSHALYVDIPGNVWLRGSGLNVELFGGIWMYKNAHEDPTLNGEIKVKRGTVDFAGHEFRTDQDSGAVVFRGPIDDPELNIIAIEQSILRTTGDQIRIRVFGTVQNSRIELSGTRADGGEMTLEEVLQRLFGAILPLAGGSGGDLQGTITTAGVSQLSGLVARAAGVDVFQFRPGTGGFSDLSGSSLEVGTYLTDRLYIRVLQPIESVQGNQDVLVEYRLFDWLKLAGHQFGTKSSEFKTVLQWEWR